MGTCCQVLRSLLVETKGGSQIKEAVWVLGKGPEKQHCEWWAGIREGHTENTEVLFYSQAQGEGPILCSLCK
ncbi:hypothetical protein XELAEV_18040856mg [Xenopus laevis]|uniref:Uncharacterized protein n=1 Tax=Xenopus laevis TaxID=8355 RepID=A0A974H9G9_XENLA|nr:hypothetical protein XELAEV_18040856mg [Xenopus laevis]